MLQQCNSGADINGMLQVMATYQNGGTSLFVVFRKQMLDGTLTAGVKEVKGLVQNQDLWL